MELDEVSQLALKMFELEAELASVKRRLADAARRNAARKDIKVRRDRIPAKEQILSMLRTAPKRTMTVREIEKGIDGVAKNTLLWTLSMMSKEKASGLVRLEQGIYQLRQ